VPPTHVPPTRSPFLACLRAEDELRKQGIQDDEEQRLLSNLRIAVSVSAAASLRIRTCSLCPAPLTKPPPPCPPPAAAAAVCAVVWRGRGGARHPRLDHWQEGRCSGCIAIPAAGCLSSGNFAEGSCGFPQAELVQPFLLLPAARMCHHIGLPLSCPGSPRPNHSTGGAGGPAAAATLRPGGAPIQPPPHPPDPTHPRAGVRRWERGNAYRLARA